MQPYDDKDENIQQNFEETVRYKKKKQSDVSKIKAKPFAFLITSS